MNLNPIPLPSVGVRIAGVGMAVPPRILTNADLEKMVQTTDEWILQRTGISRRHIVDEGKQSTMHMGAEACSKAMAGAGVGPKDLDLVICATMTQEMLCPATACRIVEMIGAVPCAAFDISIACAGFVIGLNMAHALIRAGQAKTVAVIGAETLSRVANWENRATCVLFGDAAGAAILTATDDTTRGCLYQKMGSDGSHWVDLYVPQRPCDLPQPNEFDGKYGTLQMNGREVYKFAVTTLNRCVREAMEACNLTPDDIAMVISHQSNARILESARERLGFSEDKFYINIDRYGNTSAASAGLCLAELTEQKRIKPGDYVIFVALGAGLAWAVSVWRL